MKDEQQFKALVMQKVRQQQQQKQLRLQKRRALSITISTLCVGIVCVASALWFVSALPSLQNDKERGNEDDLTYAGSVEGTIKPGNPSNNTSDSYTNEGVDNPNPNYPTNAIPDCYPGSNDTEPGANDNPFIDSIEEGGKETPETTQGIGNVNGAVPTILFNRLTLEGITPKNAAALSLQNGVTEDQGSIAQLIRLAENCVGSETASDYDGSVLFTLRAESDTTQHCYTFYEDNTLLVKKGEQSTAYRTDTDALEFLQNALRKAPFAPN